jgi:O-antigen/teichoic acid export membrane protein
MTLLRARHAAHLTAGGVIVLAAEAMALPVAFLLAAFLTRRLGPSGYGLFTLASVIVAWIEWTVGSMLSRAIVREASVAGHDTRVASAALQLNLIVGGGAASLVWLAAPSFGWLVSEPALIAPLRLLSLDIPIFAATMAHRSLLVGAGEYRARAALAAVRWLARLTLVVAFVATGWSLNGAIAGCLLASLGELVAARIAIRPRLFNRPGAVLARLLGDALPFLALGLTLRLFDRIDLLMFKTLGGSTAEAGVYGAAQSVAMSFSVISVAFPPLLLATLTRLNEWGDRQGAADIASDALRVVAWLLPLAGIAHGAGPQLATWLFGPAFQSGGSLLGLLIVTAIAQIAVAVVIMTLSAAGMPNAFLGPAVAMLGCAVALGATLIPRYGAAGAAAATCAPALLGAAWALRLAWKGASVAPPLAGVARSALAAIAAGAVCRLAAPALPLVLTLGIGAVVAAVVLQLTGELRLSDLRRLPMWTGVPAALGEVES